MTVNRIRAVHLHEVVRPLRVTFATSLGGKDVMRSIIIRVVLDDGSEGIGESPTSAAFPHETIRVMRGGLAGWASGRTWEHAGLSPEFHRLFGTGLPSMLVLFGGGALVGFGTRWSGGCTSGHGLSGCGRLQPASLIATAVFFGVAIAVSFLLERLLS